MQILHQTGNKYKRKVVKNYSVNLISFTGLFLYLTLSTDSPSLIPDAFYTILNYIYPSYTKIEVISLINSDILLPTSSTNSQEF